jgi:TetR/AcrR family transcriptional regulator
LGYTRRAIREDQKERRRGELLDVAWRLFRERPYGEITVSEVAREAGLAKGTVYLYFETKEEMFLSALERQLVSWFEHLDGRLQEMRGGCDVSGVVALLCGSLEERPALVRALAIMHGVFEQNVSFGATMRFKRTLHFRLTRTGSLLEECLPLLSVGDGLRFLLRAHALIVGLWHFADPAPSSRRALEEPGMEGFRVDFAHEFSETIRALLRGMKRESEEKQA